MEGLVDEKQLVNWLEKSIASGKSSLSDRRLFYDQLRSAIIKLPASPIVALQNGVILERAIKAVEDSQQKPYGWIDRTVGRLINTISGLKLKYGAVAAGLATISDFIKPIGNFTFLAMAAAAIFGAALCLLRPKIHLHRELTDGAIAFSGMLFVSSAIWLGAQAYVPGANASGALTKIVPGMSSIQEAMLEALSRIETQSRRTADSMEKLVPATLESKRETSQDPLKELANLGITNMHDGWVRSLWSGNTTIMKLLLASNSLPDRVALSTRLTYDRDDGSPVSNPEVLTILRGLKLQVQAAICANMDPSSVASALRNIGKVEYIYYCGVPSGIVQRYKTNNAEYWKKYCAQFGKGKINCNQNDVEGIIRAFADSDTLDYDERSVLKKILTSFETIRKAEGAGP